MDSLKPACISRMPPSRIWRSSPPVMRGLGNKPLQPATSSRKIARVEGLHSSNQWCIELSNKVAIVKSLPALLMRRHLSSQASFRDLDSEMDQDGFARLLLSQRADDHAQEGRVLTISSQRAGHAFRSFHRHDNKKPLLQGRGSGFNG